MTTRWRPLRRGLSKETLVLMEQHRRQGATPLPVHLLLVDVDDERHSRTACLGGLGEWVTGRHGQITCRACLLAARVTPGPVDG